MEHSPEGERKRLDFEEGGATFNNFDVKRPRLVV
jgi:hypothetical protein